MHMVSNTSKPSKRVSCSFSNNSISIGGFGNGLGGDEEDRVLGRSAYAEGDNRYRPSSGLDSSGIIDELSTLLTSGRLSQEKRNLIKSVYDGSQGAAKYINAQQLIATSPEFHTNGLSRSTQEDRSYDKKSLSTTNGYKAIVEIRLTGGWDSFNVLVPHLCHGTNAAGMTVDQQYRSLRGELALTQAESDFQISVDPSDGQPCSKFVIHPDLSTVKQLYDDGSLVFFANTGVLNTAETTKTNYEEVTISNLFAHNAMTLETSLIDPYRKEYGTGIMGRMSETLTRKGLSTLGVALDEPNESLVSQSTGLAPPPIIVSRFGATKFNRRPEDEESFLLKELSGAMNQKTELFSNVFSETWSAEYTSAIEQSNFLADALKETTLSRGWDGSNNKSASRLAMVARLLQTKKARGVDRDMYFVKTGFYDHHANMKRELSNELSDLESGLRAFVAEVKQLGLWDDIVVIISSEFGRTLTMNGQEGSDHAWGGHYLMFGGAVKGGRILGKYPNDLTDTGPTSIGRGRFMPTTSWDVIWNGVAQWMGMGTDEISEVLPNLHRTYGKEGFTKPFEESDLFRVSATSI